MLGAYRVTIYRIEPDGSRTPVREVMSYCLDCFFNVKHECDAPEKLPAPRSREL